MSRLPRMDPSVVLALVLIGGAIAAVVFGVPMIDRYFNGDPEVVGLEELERLPDSFEIVVSATTDCGSNGTQSYLVTDVALHSEEPIEKRAVLREWLLSQGFEAFPELEYPKGEAYQMSDVGVIIWELADGLENPIFSDRVRFTVSASDIVLRIWPTDHTIC